MSRKKKVQGNLEDAVQTFVSKNIRNGQAMITCPYFGFEYTFDNTSYIFTEEVLEGMLNTGRVKLVESFEKYVILMGVVE